MLNMSAKGKAKSNEPFSKEVEIKKTSCPMRITKIGNELSKCDTSLLKTSIKIAQRKKNSPKIWYYFEEFITEKRILFI